MIKHYDQRQLKEEIILDYGSRGARVHYGEAEAASGKTLKDHIFNHGHKAEREGENTSPFLFSSCSRCELSGFTLSHFAARMCCFTLGHELSFVLEADVSQSICYRNGGLCNTRAL